MKVACRRQRDLVDNAIKSRSQLPARGSLSNKGNKSATRNTNAAGNITHLVRRRRSVVRRLVYHSVTNFHGLTIMDH